MDEQTRIEACARAAHEVNRAYCIALGDLSQPGWDEAPDWQKESARNGVRGALAGATPEESHASWLEEKRAAGWVYGEIKDPEKKTHPCVVPYAELPEAQKLKDCLYLLVVNAVGAALDVGSSRHFAILESRLLSALTLSRAQVALERAATDGRADEAYALKDNEKLRASGSLSRTGPCLDPEKMHGWADQFPGKSEYEDDEEEGPQ